MDVSRRRRGRNGVVAGSVWESRMKHDEFKGGIKVFNSEENSEENNNTPTIEETSNTNNSSTSNASTTGLQMDKKVNLRPRQSLSGVSGKRKTWKSESSEGNPIQIARQRSELSKNVDEQCKELSVSADGIKKSPIQIKKTRSDAGKELSVVSVDGIDKSPVQTIKARSLSLKGSGEGSNASEKSPIQLRKVIKSEANKALNDDGNEKNSELRKAKTESNKVVDESSDGNVNNSLQLVRAKSVSSKVFDENGKSSKVLGGDGVVRSSVELRKWQLEKSKVVAVDGSNKNLEMPDQGIEKIPIGIKRTESDENCKEFGVCEEKVITSNFSNVGQAKSAPKSEMADDHRDDINDDNDDDDDDEDWDEVLEEVVDEDIEVEIEKKSLVIKEISIAEQKPKKVVIEEKKHQHSNERPVPISPIVKKQPPPVVNNVRLHPSPTKTKTTPVSEEFHRIPRKHRKLQSLVDLVMWKDVSKSAFIFGVGTFVIISSSYTQDLNISIISVLSYLGLVYLASIFLFRSLICRGAADIESTSQDHVVREEEAIWLMKLILPYVNELILNLRALFSGDPATTMKMAVLLFLLARCGSYITIWKMAKLGFFGVFIVPKVCSSYSTQITAYGTFWIRRFRDAWESCSHKKAVAFGVFTLVWNLSSIVARIWAVFMLFVAFKYYQQSLIREEWVEEEARAEDSWQGQMERQRKERRSTSMETRKQKKPF